MSIKIGSNELTSAGSATFNGTDLIKIIYNGTTVWAKGGAFMPDDDIALYDLTYSSGNITYKVASQGDSNYIWITTNSPVAVELQLELIWGGEIPSNEDPQHHQSATQIFNWTLPAITVPAGENILQIPAITQTVAAPNVIPGAGPTTKILSDVLVRVHNLTTGDVSGNQVWNDGVVVKW
jgi:hypothetical protein